VSTLQVVTLGWHQPGKLVVVEHVSRSGAGAAPLDAEPETEVVPAVPAVPPPEQPVETEGSHVKASPQSLSRLHGSSHL
jgi:hypothetical protein